MESVTFNHRSVRAAKARFAALLRPKAVQVAWVGIVLASLFSGILLLLSGSAIGWGLIAVASFLAPVREWWQGELKDIPPITARNGSIDALLESELLEKLPDNPSPKQLAQAVMQVPGGRFFAVRFGIGPQFLGELTSQNSSDTQAVWNEALRIRQLTGEAALSSSAVTAALVRTIPNVDAYLGRLQLDSDEIIFGAQWYAHLRELINSQKTPLRTGGIARDWSFGYIPTLQRFGYNISTQVANGGILATKLETHQDVLRQTINVLGGNGARNVALVGGLGVGKSTIVHAFAEELLKANNTNIPTKLRFRQVISLDAGALIGQAGGRGELEQLVNRLLMEAYRAKNIIICLDDAQLFFEEGVGSVNISNILLPVLEGGALPVILTMDEQRWLQIAQRNPQLVNTLNRVSVTEANQEETMRVLQDQLLIMEFKHKVTYMYQAMREAYRLSDRYMHDTFMPGKAIKLLESASGYGDSSLITAGSVQTAIERTLDVKVAVASGQDERATLLTLEDQIHERMINQTRAVKVVSDALRRARAGVRNQDRPVGTFLFLGPTGVGKTELSKALGEVYYGGADRMIRIDMNEFVRSEDVSRLIADGAHDPHGLVAGITKQPFSVVLLDEIEKAHPDVLGTLLQLLDEGVLRDVNNRQVSFRDAIIIATSNAGADKIRERIMAGQDLSQFEDQIVNELIDSGAFRPEFLNRFDEIVVFRPLTQDELVQVVDLIIKGINKNLALQKISITVDEQVKRLLVERGYDARLGARPMRRIVQRTVENIIAKRMLSGTVMPGTTLQIGINDIQEEIRSS